MRLGREVRVRVRVTVRVRVRVTVMVMVMVRVRVRVTVTVTVTVRVCHILCMTGGREGIGLRQEHSRREHKQGNPLPAAEDLVHADSQEDGCANNFEIPHYRYSRGVQSGHDAEIYVVRHGEHECWDDEEGVLLKSFQLWPFVHCLPI